MTTPWYVQPRVAAALADGAPVVALESTLLAHGLPYPDNLQLAHDLDRIIAGEGAVPATIAVVRGQPTIGLSPDELGLIAMTPDLPKLSIRDLPLAVATGRSGATTVASTAHLAALAGIRLFATGGLGGVHRDARESWDISADLLALQTTPVAVVCAGVKSLLDVPATLEYLETCGVPVVGYRTKSFPGFYRTDAGCALDWAVQTPTEAAQVIRSLSALGLERRGLVLAHPLPEGEQLDGALHERVLAEGLAQLRANGVRGKAVTPFLLAHFHRQTGGASLAVNKRIVQHNARLAAQVAAALATLDRADADADADAEAG